MFNILVVDDEKNARVYMEAVLKKNNYRVFTASDGEEALDVLDREHIDLVLLDIMMPNMDGYEFTQTVRAVDGTLPILMISAKQLPDDRHKGFLAGTDDYMTKPVDEEEMHMRIFLKVRLLFVTVHIGRLRKRFENWNEFSIESVRGLGYRAVKNV